MNSSGGVAPRAHAVRRLRLCRTACLLAVLAAAPLAAQRAGGPNTDLAPASELGSENLKRVTASADQIEQVLRAHPGLLLELKRWEANDATLHGQVVTDSDLSDGAVFDRIESDAAFRATATRLLERYGYLIPQFNPAAQPAARPGSLLAEADCDRAQDPEADAGCRKTSPPTHHAPAGTAIPSQSSPGARPAAQSPASAPRPLRDTSRPNYIAPVPTNPSAGTEDKLREAQLTESPFAPEGGTGGDAPSAGEVSPEQLPDTASPPVAQPQAEASAPVRGGGRAKPPSKAASLVERRNPFPDIPSLYDMYLQVSPHAGKLDRFGERVFTGSARDRNLLPTDLPVGPDYVVGPGDGLNIDLWGGVSQRLTRTVDRTGRVTLPEVGPLLVSGHTLGEVQRSVEQTLRTQFRDVSADVSLARLRSIRVYVVGDVRHPGAYDISSLSTPLNALFAAGGPTANGSLRMVRQYRGNRLVQQVDLYDLLLHGVDGHLARLENGDTVLVPPPGPQVKVEGAVRRPAIYELRTEKALPEVLALAGGILPTAALEHIEVQRVVAHSKRTMVSLDLPAGANPAGAMAQLASFRVQDGDTIHIFPIAPYNTKAVYLDGHVLRPGRYSFHPGMRVTDLISSYDDLLPEPATRYAEIIRLRPPDDHPVVESFDLARALAHPKQAPMLHVLDTVRIFGRYAFQSPPTVSVGGEVRRPGTYRTDGQIHLRDAIALAGGLTPAASEVHAQVFLHGQNGTLRVTDVNLGRAMDGDPLDNLLLGPQDRVVVHRNLAQVDPPSVSVQGEVARPGHYPLAQGMRVGDLIRLAGGLKRSADPALADLTEYLAPNEPNGTGVHREVHIARALAGDRADDLPLHDGDTLTIRQATDWNERGASVVLRGQVAHPGRYGIGPGERLSSLLARAGGLLATAYPEGAVFERERVRQLQRESKQRLIAQIRAEAGTFRTSVQDTPQDKAALSQAALEQRTTEIQALEQTPVTGRLVVHVPRDWKRLAGTADDIGLRDGDTIFIPKQPAFIVVTGQVYNSNAITYQPRRNAAWYLAQAGGPTDQANRKAIFIIRANGAVISGSHGGWWSGGVLSTVIEPGDSIVVPEKAIGGTPVWKNLIAISQLAQAAATTAFIATR